MSELSPADKFAFCKKMMELGLLNSEEALKVLGMYNIRMGEPPPDFDDGEEEVAY